VSRPRFDREVTVTSPGAPAPEPDPVTGQPVDLPPSTTDGWASIRQRTTTNLGSSTEIVGQQSTTVTLYNGLFDPVLRAALTEKSTVTDLTKGGRYEVEGDVADRGGFLAAALRRISDLQEGPS
jgi:hypothetical protein